MAALTEMPEISKAGSRLPELAAVVGLCHVPSSEKGRAEPTLFVFKLQG